MILKTLKLRNFRNIASADLCFHPKVNIFLGNNAQGKTNLCEAVSICLGKNFRNPKANEILPFGCDENTETIIELTFSFDNIEKDNTILYTQKNGNIKLTFNDIEMKSAEKLYGALRYVSFIPEDLYIVKGNPEKRRDYLDYVSNMINRVHNQKLYEYNKALAKEVKKLHPSATIVFGGHNVQRDFRTFDECPEADYIIYREGEEAFRKLVLCLLNGESPENVENIAYRTANRYFKTKEKDFCLSEYPSPYLNGFFDGISDGKTNFSAILETNRGCPFKCAFCDWGTLGSRVRAFPMERVRAEIDWIASHGIEYVYCADGNFGIFDRDEEIAEYIISSKIKTGYPKNFRVCFTKNSF